MGYDHGTPPSQWDVLKAAGVQRASENVYVGWLGDNANPTVWHWCTAANLPSPRWVASTTDNHQLISRDPLHLEPSLYWPHCCGLHGWIRDGQWTGA